MFLAIHTFIIWVILVIDEISVFKLEPKPFPYLPKKRNGEDTETRVHKEDEIPDHP